MFLSISRRLPGGRRAAWGVCALLVSLLYVSPVRAQQCYIKQQYQCGPGTLCSPDGTCKPINTVIKGTVYWVDKAKGSDSNNGSQASPWKTISRAAEALRPGEGVIVRAGTYHEAILPGRAGTSSAPITYAAYPGETVVVSGAEPLNLSWTKVGNLWVADWPYNEWLFASFNQLTYYRAGALKFDAARHKEVVIADGQMLDPYYLNIDTWNPAATPTDMPQGTFYVQGSGSLASQQRGKPEKVYVRLKNDKNPNNAVMETSRKPHLFNPSGQADCTFPINRTGEKPKSYLHLQGFTFRHVANFSQQGAVCTGQTGTIIDNVTVEWTNGSGFLVFGSDNLLRGVRALYNGMEGIKGGYDEELGCNRCSVTNSVSRFNNWKGHDPFQESGGGKWQYTTNSTFRHNEFSNNYGPGLWFDLNNDKNVIEQNYFRGNLGVNLFLESKSHRSEIRNNVITQGLPAEQKAGDKFDRKWEGIVGNRFVGHGLIIDVSEGNRVLYNTFMGNNGGGLRIGSDERGDGVTTQYHNNVFVNNLIGRDGADLGFEKYVELAPALTNKGGGNVFWPRSTDDHHVFRFEPKGGAPLDGFATNKLADWQNFAKTDYTSKLIQTGQPHLANPNDPANGWMPDAGSQLMGIAVALPAGVEPVVEDYFGNPRPASGGAVGAVHGPGEPAEPQGQGVSLAAGWNLVGLPLVAPDNRVTVVYPTAVKGTLYSFNGSYVSPADERLEGGKGYWVLNNQAETHIIEGVPAGARTWTLRAGWNLVSGPTCEIAVGQAEDPENLLEVSSLYGYSNGYVTPPGNTLKPGLGYWIRARKAGTVTLTCGGSGGKTTVAETAEALDDFGVLMLAGPSGMRRALYFGGRFADAGMADAFVLPPVPPEGSFDARFGTDRTVAGHDEAPVVAYQAGGEVTAWIERLPAGGGAFRLVELDEAGNVRATFEPAPGQVITLPQKGHLRLQSAETPTHLPADYALEDSYPNPFDARTEIRYAVPASGPVRLVVYDVLGREVTTLVDEVREAGWHRVAVDGAGLPSGLYFYRLTAGDYSETRRMIRLR